MARPKRFRTEVWYTVGAWTLGIIIVICSIGAPKQKTSNVKGRDP